MNNDPTDAPIAASGCKTTGAGSHPTPVAIGATIGCIA
jgi:hypothetical protein